MTAPTQGLSALEMHALVRRDLEAEPGVTLREMDELLGVVCVDGMAGDDSPQLFGIAGQGGLLLRMPEDARTRIIDNGVGQANAALPARIDEVVAGEAHRGSPNEWVWVPVADAAAYERRRPHLLEALGFCRHMLTTRRGKDPQSN